MEAQHQLGGYVGVLQMRDDAAWAKGNGSKDDKKSCMLALMCVDWILSIEIPELESLRQEDFKFETTLSSTAKSYFKKQAKIFYSHFYGWRSTRELRRCLQSVTEFGWHRASLYLSFCHQLKTELQSLVSQGRVWESGAGTYNSSHKLYTTKVGVLLHHKTQSVALAHTSS